MSERGGFFKICSFDYWKNFFNFEESEIKERLKSTATCANLGSLLYDDPDLYNPVWINMTLVFSLIVVSNIAWYLKTKENFHFDYKVVPKAFNIVWGLAFIVPSLSCLMFFVFGFSMSFKTIISIFAIYSYSNIYFVLASFFTIIPIKIF